MKKLWVVTYALCAIASVFMLSGCVVRTYSLTRDRVDQNLEEGNRGYLKGQAPQVQAPYIQPPAMQQATIPAKAPAPNLVLIVIICLLAFLVGGILVYLMVKPK